MAADGLKVIIFGGCGFIGRHLVTYLVENNKATLVCVVDKVPPQMAYMNAHHEEIFKDSRVVFKSGNLIKSATLESLKDLEFDWAINAAGETKLGQVEAVYEEGIFKLSTNCAKAAASMAVRIYVEISSGQLSSSEKQPHEELSKCNPWTLIGKYKFAAEKEIREIPNLNWIILRPALVYGTGDKRGLTNHLVMGVLYKQLKETMKLLWDDKLKTNTVHVEDLVSVMVQLCERGRTQETYNVVDKANTSQGQIAAIISDIFGIKVDYYGGFVSNLTKVDMKSVVEDVNDKHLHPWAQLCNEYHIQHTPLTPYVDQELLHKNHLHLSGDKLEKDLKYQFKHPKPTKDLLRQIIDDYKRMKQFPNLPL